MQFTSLINKTITHFNTQQPFVLYSLPGNNEVIGNFQKDNILYTTEFYTEDCFVFAPFNCNEKTYCIPSEKCEVLKTTFLKKEFTENVIEITEAIQEKENYCQQIKKTVKVIESGRATKIVYSRKKEIVLKQLNLKQLIIRILNLYPTAFRYIWYHPKTGLWCGATPETLLQTEGGSFTTMALAGTRKVSNIAPKWNYKEIIEQKIVVNAICKKLEKLTSLVKKSKTYNHTAASLVHLRTDITGVLKKEKPTIAAITSVLHPTPAVCGTPQDFAKRYILENENYNREFYTGFLGPIYIKNYCSKLFVNLRCMKIKDNSASLYVGGGITADSNPINEWEETQDKLQTMLQVLQPML